MLKSLCQSSDEDFSEFNKFISEFDSYFITKFFPSSNEDQTEISENNGETEEDEEKKDEKESGNKDETEDKPEQNEHKTNTPTTFETNNISPIKAKETYNRIAN